MCLAKHKTFFVPIRVYCDSDYELHNMGRNDRKLSSKCTMISKEICPVKKYFLVFIIVL
jgi:hypothetical protein